MIHTGDSYLVLAERPSATDVVAPLAPGAPVGRSTVLVELEQLEAETPPGGRGRGQLNARAEAGQLPVLLGLPLLLFWRESTQSAHRPPLACEVSLHCPPRRQDIISEPL